MADIESSLYEMMGGEKGLRSLVDRFYDLMDSSPEAEKIRVFHAQSLKQSREKLFMFLSGWSGGPQLYVEKFGHPRQSGILGGIPATVSASTVNKVCGSGLKAAMFASQAVRAGDADLFVAGGFESMSRVPYLVSGRSGELKFGNQSLTDALLYDGLWDPFENWGMGNAAEFIAEEYEVTREAMDQWALQSHQKAVEAQERGRFEEELVPVPIPGRKGGSDHGGTR